MRNLQAATVTAASESPQVKAWMHSMMVKHGWTEQEVRRRSVIAYGSVESTMRAMESAEAENKAAIARGLPDGHVINIAGRKPNPGEEVFLTQLRDDVMIRVWGGDLATLNSYSFDFINKERQYILTPEDIKVFTVETALCPSLRVYSIEDLLDAQGSSLYSHATRQDPNWETYVIHEGTILRITQHNHPDRYLHIPLRIPQDATLVLERNRHV